MIEFTTLYVVGMSLLILMGFGVLVYQVIDNRKFKKQIASTLCHEIVYGGGSFFFSRGLGGCSPPGGGEMKKGRGVLFLGLSHICCALIEYKHKDI